MARVERDIMTGVLDLVPRSLVYWEALCRWHGTREVVKGNLYRPGRQPGDPPWPGDRLDRAAPRRIEVAGALAQRGRRGLGRGNDRGALAGGDGEIVVVEQHGFETLAHVPLDMAGEHAQEDMGAHPGRQPMVDRAQMQIDGLEAAKGALDPGEALVGADHVVGRQGFVFDAGTDDIKAVEPGFVGDAG